MYNKFYVYFFSLLILYYIKWLDLSWGRLLLDQIQISNSTLEFNSFKRTIDLDSFAFQKDTIADDLHGNCIDELNQALFTVKWIMY